MRTVLIAGGGIAGMTAALAFRRAGWSVEVCERREALGEVGAGLQLSPNAVRVLDWLGVLGALCDTAVAPGAAILRDGLTGAEIYRAPLGSAAADRWGAPYLHVHRADLLRALTRAAEAAGVTVTLGVRAERAVRHTDGMALHTADGKVLPADLVIGADGIRSALRAQINPREAPRFTGQIAWRGLVPADAVPEGTIPRDATVWAGPGQHLVTYYVRGGELINLVAVCERTGWTEEGWSVPAEAEEIAAAFTGWHPSVRALLERAENCFLWGLFDRPEQVRWTEGGLVLIGDAAHPMLPFMAQGAAQALEDVAVLLRHLGQTPTQEALVAYEAERWPRVTRILHRAQANGRLFHRRPGLARWLARLPLSLASRYAPGLAAGQLDWLYGHDPVTGRAAGDATT